MSDPPSDLFARCPHPRCYVTWVWLENGISAVCPNCGRSAKGRGYSEACLEGLVTEIKEVRDRVDENALNDDHRRWKAEG